MDGDAKGFGNLFRRHAKTSHIFDLVERVHA